MSKRGDAPYASRRSSSWLKVKATGREELIILGYTDPEGSRVGFGGLILGYHSRTADGPLMFAGGVGTGFDNRTLAYLHGRLEAMEQDKPNTALPKGFRHGSVHWVHPALVCEVAFAEWTRDGILRHPSFLGLREDKPARDVVLDREMSAEAKVSRWGGMRRA